MDRVLGLGTQYYQRGSLPISTYTTAFPKFGDVFTSVGSPSPGLFIGRTGVPAGLGTGQAFHLFGCKLVLSRAVLQKKCSDLLSTFFDSQH
jgi:hypothetical protein